MNSDTTMIYADFMEPKHLIHHSVHSVEPNPRCGEFYPTIVRNSNTMTNGDELVVLQISLGFLNQTARRGESDNRSSCSA